MFSGRMFEVGQSIDILEASSSQIQLALELWQLYMQWGRLPCSCIWVGQIVVVTQPGLITWTCQLGDVLGRNNPPKPL